MTSVQYRRSMTAGVAFVVLLVTGVFVSFGNSPNIKSTDSAAIAAAKYVTTLSSSSHRVGLLIGAYLLLLAAFLFLWYVQGLRTRAATTSAQRLVAALAVVGAGALSAAAMASAAVAGAVSFGGEKVPQNGDSIMVVMDLFFPFIFVVFGLASAAIIATLAISGGHSDLPTWLIYTAWLAVLGGIFAVTFTPMVLVLLWYLAFAIAGLMRPSGGDVFAPADIPMSTQAGVR